ncbi:hypothetical protein IEO21_07524 [Rhodonia placenta]|uniref:Alpha/beta hydrolase fold-3 domain-containing protein n=1 Tax=Rhodonia placenta TaxID=104341 RepID=A0A8H7NYA0_9APHY|nr:hypothetical protein IEO21_07524 [Postia placenta]
MVPFWVLLYAVLPRSFRPRRSWSIKQIVAVNFTRRIYKVTERAGVTWGTRDPEEACDNRALKETRFEWVDPLPERLRTGIVADGQVPFKRVGVFVWPKDGPEGSIQRKESGIALTSPSDVEARAGNEPLIGIFLHGGGYCHMSAHESSSTSKIPRQLSKDANARSFIAVEYRLLQHAPFPAAVQDAAAVYAHIVRQHQRLSTDCKVVLIGDSAGGNLVLALARWIRDEGVLPPPDGLLLLSPSCDPSHAFPESPSSYIPRPHGSTDYLVDTPEPRALLQRTFLGHNPLETMHSPYVSPASMRVLRAYYGDAFAHSVQDLTIKQMDTAARKRLREMTSVPGTPAIGPETPFEPSTNGEVNGLKPSPTSLARPQISSPRGLSLFSEFPRACIVLGDAERLEREVMKLVSGMERDGVDVRTIWVEDGVHDVLMMGWWDERVRAKVWGEVEDWLGEI